MHFPRHYKTEIGRLDITPLIDVVFLLLIFFMLTSKFVTASGINVHLPQSQSKEPIRQKGLIITIDKKGDVYLPCSESVQGLENRKTDFNKLGLALKSFLSRCEAEGKDKSVIIYADKQIALERVIKVWDVCRENGIREIGISTLPKE